MTLSKPTYFNVPLGTEVVVFSLLIFTTLMVRINHLAADPPIDLSISQGIFTDPAQYVSYARNYILMDALNPLNDFRLLFFLKSVTTALAVVVFKLFGVGYMQSNMVGLIFSFSTIVLFYFALRKMAGNVAALLFLVFISLDYNQIFYGRLPFLENGMNFFIILALTIVLYANKGYAFLLAGIFLGCGIFFGKIIGLISLFPFACLIGYEYFYDYRDKAKRLFLNYGFFIFGFLALFVIWYFISYRPMTAAVEGYVEEQAFNLYGAPDAFKNLSTFIYNYLSFGASSRLFGRMVVPGLLTIFMLMVFFYRAGFKQSWKERFYGFDKGTIFLIAFVIAAYGALMIWNYRPLRYQTMLIYPICGLAGIYLSQLLSAKKISLSPRGNYLFYAVFLILISKPIYQFMSPIYNYFDKPYHFLETRMVLLTISVIITIGAVLITKFAPLKFLKPPFIVKAVIILLAVVGTVAPNSIRYLNWNSMVSYNTVNNSRDLATLLSPEAVISGPYAADFTLENRFMNFIHMFGVASIDSTMFRKYPITHLLLDISNAKRARKDYGAMMDSASQLAKYNVGGREIALLRIAGLTGNSAANRYAFSDFELAMHFIVKENNAPLGNKYLLRHMQKNPENMSTNLALALVAFDNQAYLDSEQFYKRAIDFAPTDFRLHLLLGEFYINMYNMSNNGDYRKRAIAEFELARKYNYGSKKLEKKIKELLSAHEKPLG